MSTSLAGTATEHRYGLNPSDRHPAARPRRARPLPSRQCPRFTPQIRTQLALELGVGRRKQGLHRRSLAARLVRLATGRVWSRAESAAPGLRDSALVVYRAL